MEDKKDSKRNVEMEQRIGKFVRDFSIAVQDEQSVNYNILRKMLRELLASEISKAREEGYEKGKRYQMELNEMLNGVSVQENTLEKGKEYVVISKETYNKLTTK